MALCRKRAATRQPGAIIDKGRYRLEDGQHDQHPADQICDGSDIDHDRVSLAPRKTSVNPLDATDRFRR